MTVRQFPGLGLTGGWATGANGWGAAVNANLRLVSAVVGGGVLSRTDAIPGTGSAGDVYIVPSDAMAEANNVAIWDGPDTEEDWVYLTPQPGWTFYVIDDEESVRWSGTAWEVFPEPPSATPVEALPASPHTLVQVDRGKLLEVSSGSAYALTIPANATEAIGVGSMFALTQIGAGVITITAAAGVTINGVSEGEFAFTGQFASASFYKRAADAWVIFGGVEEVV